MGSIISQWEAYDILTPPEIVLEAFKHTFHAMDWNPFHYTRKKLVYLHLKDFLSYGCELYLKQPLTPPNTKLLLLTTLKSQSCHQNWSVVNYPQDKKLCHLCSYNVAENEAHFVLGYLLYNFFRERFPFIFQSIVLGSLKSFFQSIYQVDVSLYLI